MQIKTLPATVKTITGSDPEGTFEALVSTYAVDSVGDQVQPGAFTKTLDDWGSSGSPLPVIWSHQHDDPFAHVGTVVEAEERPDGLWVKATLDLDNPTGKQVYRLVKGGRVRNFSFAYDVLDSAPSEATPGVVELKEIKLYEVGPTLIGANQDTRTLAVKTRPSVDDLRSALDVVRALVGTVDGPTPTTDEEQAKTSARGPAKDDDLPGVASEEPSRAASVRSLTASIQLRQRKETPSWD